MTTVAARRPRFRRDAAALQPMQMTARDLEILRCIAAHRFLRSSQLAALVGGSVQQVLRRLQLLYHHGYLERPAAQIDYYHRGGSKEMVALKAENEQLQVKNAKLEYRVQHMLKCMEELYSNQKQ